MYFIIIIIILNYTFNIFNEICNIINAFFDVYLIILISLCNNMIGVSQATNNQPHFGCGI